MKLGYIDERLWDKKRELVITVVALLASIAFFGLFIFEQVDTVVAQFNNKNWLGLVSITIFNLLILVLFYGGLLYQFTRLGYLVRRNRYIHSAQSSEHGLFSLVEETVRPSILVLIPSYKEELEIVKMTLLSAIFQTNVKRRVTLLIDDPPNPSSETDRKNLEATRELPKDLKKLISQPKSFIEKRERQFRDDIRHQSLAELPEQWAQVRELWVFVLNWFVDFQKGFEALDHHTKLFKEQVLQAHINRSRHFIECCNRAILINLDKKNIYLSAKELTELTYHYDTLLSIFSVDIDSFERKRYLNLSHEPNKAMNLNSYIGLLGNYYVEQKRDDGLVLRSTTRNAATVKLEKPDYIITLDADSILLPHYTDKLVSYMEKEENMTTAVIQTPYSSFPGANTVLERVSGITTDIQYIIHQGFTAFSATYWVGANALIKMQALEDIVQIENENGIEVSRYIHDRTVIEDTESSIDLVEKGWRLHNHPERLAYSATPPDYGSLLIQRRRWANGGLIIFPKLLGYLLRWPWSFAKFAEGFFRVHYLVSIAMVNVALLLLLATPFAAMVDTIWLPLTCVPYFFLYCRDMVLCGYRKSDFLRVYALNLLLIPVNLGGVAKSLQQGIFRMKIPFGRTPKVQSRTAADPLYIYFSYTLMLSWIVGVGFDLYSNHLTHGIFALVNALFLLYACVKFIGIKESWEDSMIPTLLEKRRVLLKRRRATEEVGEGQVTYITASDKVGGTAVSMRAVKEPVSRGL